MYVLLIIFNINNKLSITPGIRYEYIETNALGEYRETQYDLAENIIFDTLISSVKNNNRGFVIAGIGLNYKINNEIEVYQNISQNYRSIHFTEMQIVNPNFKIDPNLQDETGFNSDLGFRGKIAEIFFFDFSLFFFFLIVYRIDLFRDWKMILLISIIFLLQLGLAYIYLIIS